MTDQDGMLVQSYQPATFQERGLAVGYTTPLLAGARLRGAPDDGSVRAIELVVANPSGGRGVYVVQWQRVGELCRPTLHDTRLGAAIEAHHRLHHDLTPAEIRRLTRAVVQEGFAGREAAQAGLEAAFLTDRRVADTHRRLLASLADSDLHAEVSSPVRARRAMAPVAAETGRSIDEVAAAMERLAHVAADAGGEPGGFVTRGAGQLAELAAMIGRRARNESAPEARAAAFVAANAELTLSLVRRATRALQVRLAMPAALAEWVRNPAGLLEAAARPEWLLDGWGRICLLWEASPRGVAPASIIAEMAALVPPVPPQADAWLDLPPGTATRGNATQQGVRHGPANDAGAKGDIAYNEHLLALAA